MVDLHTMSVIKRLPTESKPNGIAYAEPFRKIYVVNTLGKAVSVVDVNKDEIVKVLRFNSETGTPGYDAVAKKVYVTLRSTNEVAEIDPFYRSRYRPVSSRRLHLQSRHGRGCRAPSSVPPLRGNAKPHRIRSRWPQSHCPLPTPRWRRRCEVRFRAGPGVRRMFEWRHLGCAGRLARPLSEN